MWARVSSWTAFNTSSGPDVELRHAWNTVPYFGSIQSLHAMVDLVAVGIGHHAEEEFDRLADAIATGRRQHSRPQRPFGSEERFDPGGGSIGRLQLLAGDGNRVKLFRQHLPDGSIYRDSMPGGQRLELRLGALEGFAKLRGRWLARSLLVMGVLREDFERQPRLLVLLLHRRNLALDQPIGCGLELAKHVLVLASRSWGSSTSAGHGRVYVEPAAAGNLRRGDGHGIFDCRVQASASSTRRADQSGQSIERDAETRSGSGKLLSHPFGRSDSINS